MKCLSLTSIIFITVIHLFSQELALASEGHAHYGRSKFDNGSNSLRAIPDIWSNIILKESELKIAFDSGELLEQRILAREIDHLVDDVISKLTKNPARMTRLKSILKRTTRTANRIDKLNNSNDARAGYKLIKQLSSFLRQVEKELGLGKVRKYSVSE